jgi:hypothetical protein
MADTGQLLFGNLPSVPVLWMIGLLGFIAFWWYVCRTENRVRRLFLALWLPAAVVVAALYSLDGHGYAVSESLGLLVHRDPGILRLVRWMPSDGFSATYAVITGGAVAALATMALQFVGVLVGALLGLVPSVRLNPPRSPRLSR